MKEYIKEHFGSQVNCARELGVTPATVQNWVKKNPRGILKYGPEIVASKNTTWLQLEGEVMYRIHEIEELEPIREGDV
jgi:predicted transcriptional regulator